MNTSTMLNISSVALICSLTACGGNQKVQHNNSNIIADTVITNATIYTLDQEKPWAQAIAIKNEKIVFVGDLKDVAQFKGSQTRVIDAQQRLVLPGFHDVHMHPLESASDATHFSLPEYASKEEYQDIIHQAALNHPDTPWLIGYGASLQSIQELASLPLSVIDEVVESRPVIIMEQTSHSMWVNTKALQISGIEHFTADPKGGVIGRTEQGELNGVLYDNAGNLVMDLAMAASSQEQQENYLGFIEYTQPQLLAHGITSISDARVYWQRGQLDTWKKLNDTNELKLRVSLGLWAYPNANDESQIAALKSMFHNSNEMLKVNQIKFYMDGILVNTTAAMKEPYVESWLNLPDDKGLNYFTQERLEKYIKALEPVGFDFNIHGIGDRGIHEALNAIEQASRGNNARHRITHVEVIDEQDLPRFKGLGVIADAQVAGDFTQPIHWREMEPLLGQHRANNLVPIRSLIDNKAMLTLSSDWNVSSFNPFIGLANAMSRTPQAISLEQAIKAYTINAAFALRQDDILGSLSVGKRADLIIIDRNIFELHADDIANTHVEMTMINGKVLYLRE